MIMIVIGLFLPRLVSIILYFFSSWFAGIFNTWYWPVLGFIFAPYTLLCYSAVANWYGYWGFWQIVFLVIAILFDLVSGSRANRSQEDISEDENEDEEI